MRGALAKWGLDSRVVATLCIEIYNGEVPDGSELSFLFAESEVIPKNEAAIVNAATSCWA